MAAKKRAPESSADSARATISVDYKGRKISLSELQNCLFILLANGKKHSSHKIMQKIHTSDPRKEVQYLRRKGINVEDEWIEATGKFSRHKLYFIDPKECSNE